MSGVTIPQAGTCCNGHNIDICVCRKAGRQACVATRITWPGSAGDAKAPDVRMSFLRLLFMHAEAASFLLLHLLHATRGPPGAGSGLGPIAPYCFHRIRKQCKEELANTFPKYCLSLLLLLVLLLLWHSMDSAHSREHARARPLALNCRGLVGYPRGPG